MYAACTSSQPVGGLSRAQLVVALPAAAVVVVAASAVVFVAVAGYSYARVTHPFPLSLSLSLTPFSLTLFALNTVCVFWLVFLFWPCCVHCSTLLFVALRAACCCCRCRRCCCGCGWRFLNNPAKCHESNKLPQHCCWQIFDGLILWKIS